MGGTTGTPEGAPLGNSRLGQNPLYPDWSTATPAPQAPVEGPTWQPPQYAGTAQAQVQSGNLGFPGGFQHSPYDNNVGRPADTGNNNVGQSVGTVAGPAAPAVAADNPNDWYYYGKGSGIAQGTPWMKQQALGAAGNATSTIGDWGRRQADGSIVYMPDPWKTPS